MGFKMENAKYKAVYDTDEDIDSEDCNDFDTAVNAAFEMLKSWMSECVSEYPDEGNYMISNCHTWVEEYDEETGEYEDVWCPSKEDLIDIGWVKVDYNREICNGKAVP